MPWWHFALLGAGGGLAIEALAIFHCCCAWQAARRTKGSRLRTNPPLLSTYLDVPAHACLALIRGLFGATTSLLFGTSGQIDGAVAAVALGVAAPAVLAQLGRALPGFAQATEGTSTASDPVPDLAGNRRVSNTPPTGGGQ